MVQWLRLCPSSAAVWVQPLVRELRSHMHMVQPKYGGESTIFNIITYNGKEFLIEYVHIYA